MTLANFREYISKKPLIPNTTKVLKTKKTKISKNKFNPKNVFCALKLVYPPKEQYYSKLFQEQIKYQHKKVFI